MLTFGCRLFNSSCKNAVSLSKWLANYKEPTRCSSRWVPDKKFMDELKETLYHPEAVKRNTTVQPSSLPFLLIVSSRLIQCKSSGGSICSSKFRPTTSCCAWCPETNYGAWWGGKEHCLVYSWSLHVISYKSLLKLSSSWLIKWLFFSPFLMGLNNIPRVK